MILLENTVCTCMSISIKVGYFLVFTKNENTLEIPRQIFPNFSKYTSELSSFMSASLKAIVTVEIAPQNVGQI